MQARLRDHLRPGRLRAGGDHPAVVLDRGSRSGQVIRGSGRWLGIGGIAARLPRRPEAGAEERLRSAEADGQGDHIWLVGQGATGRPVGTSLRQGDEGLSAAVCTAVPKAGRSATRGERGPFADLTACRIMSGLPRSNPAGWLVRIYGCKRAAAWIPAVRCPVCGLAVCGWRVAGGGRGDMLGVGSGCRPVFVLGVPEGRRCRILTAAWIFSGPGRANPLRVTYQGDLVSSASNGDGRCAGK